MGVGGVIEKVGGGVYDSPVGQSACVAKGIEPGFLDGYNIPLLWAGCFEDILLSILGFVGILLPYAEFAWGGGESYNHWVEAV